MNNELSILNSMIPGIWLNLVAPLSFLYYFILLSIERRRGQVKHWSPLVRTRRQLTKSDVCTKWHRILCEIIFLANRWTLERGRSWKWEWGGEGMERERGERTKNKQYIYLMPSANSFHFERIFICEKYLSESSNGRLLTFWRIP